MPAPSVLFYGALTFLLGVLLASLGLTYQVLLIVAALAAVLLIVGFFAPRFISVLAPQGETSGILEVSPWGAMRRRCFVLAALAPLIIAGSVYYHFDDMRFRASAVSLGTQTLRGVVVNDPVLRDGYRSAFIRLDPPAHGAAAGRARPNDPARTALSGWRPVGRVIANLPPYPAVRYGDEVSLAGVVKQPEPEGYARYLAKERVSGVMNRPTVTVVARGQGSPIQSALFSLKHAVTGVFARVLPAEDASFLSGLTVGERGAFSDELKNSMQRSGTTHLVALSGYNITILGEAVMGAALWLISRRRRAAFLVTLAVILGFVCMAGAEASVVRAAIMGSLALAAKETGRLFDVRQAVVLAGLAMVLVNPKVLAFDVGFQLSFVALLGIVYLEPVLRRFTASRGNKGFLDWRTTLSTTAAAQLAVAPILIAQFGMVSVTSLAANLLILAAVPITMGVGFLTAAVGAASILLAQVVGLVAWALTQYELGVIRLFSLISVPVAPAISWAGAFAYYAVLIGFVVWMTRTHLKNAHT
ncbi:MAG: ComEC/Rec2 family competence protein [bacterium]|nr:ComEC/Rec2 family competence protein [bacterium]